MKVITVNVPDYSIDIQPDYKAAGAIVDTELKKHFMGQMVGLRALGSQEHPGKTIDDLIEIIKRDGTDRYDPERGGDRYDNVEGKHIDLFVLTFLWFMISLSSKQYALPILTKDVLLLSVTVISSVTPRRKQMRCWASLKYLFR